MKHNHFVTLLLKLHDIYFNNKTIKMKIGIIMTPPNVMSWSHSTCLGVTSAIFSMDRICFYSFNVFLIHLALQWYPKFIFRCMFRYLLITFFKRKEILHPFKYKLLKIRYFYGMSILFLNWTVTYFYWWEFN